MNIHNNTTINTYRNAIVKIPYGNCVGISYYNEETNTILSTDKPNETNVEDYTPIKTYMNVGLPAIYTFSIYDNEVYFPQINTTYRPFNNYFSHETFIVDPATLHGRMAITWNRKYKYNEFSLLYSNDSDDTTEDNITYTSIGLYNSIDQIIFNNDISHHEHNFARILDEDVALLPQNYHLSYQHSMLHEYLLRFTHNMIIRIGRKIRHSKVGVTIPAGGSGIHYNRIEVMNGMRGGNSYEYTFQALGNANDMVGVRTGSMVEIDTNDTFYDNRTHTTFVRLRNNRAIIRYNNASTIHHHDMNDDYYIPIYTDGCISSSLQIL